MMKLIGNRKVWVVALVLVFLAAVLTALPPTGQVGAASNCTYYSNAGHTTVVGRFGYDCCNNPVSWGKKSKFVVCGGCFPCTPPPQ